MFVRLAEGKVKIDPEREAEFYEFAWDYLPKHGYDQYEVSNYAKPGHACRHNLNTWAMNEWLGYGPSACTQYQGIRRKNITNLEEWVLGMQPGDQPKFIEQETLSSTDFAQDAVLFGLRMNRGISIPNIAKKFDIQIDQFSGITNFMNRLVSEGLAVHSSSGSYALSRQGRILCDAISCDLPNLGSPN